jgi:hypothetical protein
LFWYLNVYTQTIRTSLTISTCSKLYFVVVFKCLYTDSGPHLQVSTCSKLCFVLVFKCLCTDYQDHTYKLVHVVNWASSFGILLKFKHNDLWHSIMVWSHLVDCSCVPFSKQEEYMCQNRVQFCLNKASRKFHQESKGKTPSKSDL